MDNLNSIVVCDYCGHEHNVNQLGFIPEKCEQCLNPLVAENAEQDLEDNFIIENEDKERNQAKVKDKIVVKKTRICLTRKR